MTEIRAEKQERKLRNWEQKYGVDHPLPVRIITCHVCHTPAGKATIYRTQKQGQYICRRCLEQGAGR